jgi:acetyltransferase-like isoleucine patch superfamily enzyme
MNSLKEDLIRLNEFLKSDSMTIDFVYTNMDPFFLRHFCKILRKTFYNKISGFVSIIQRYMVFSGIKQSIYRTLRVKIGKHTYFGPFVSFDPNFPDLIEIGDHVIISPESKFLTHEISHNKLRIGRIKIGNNVIIGFNSIIKCGITIGNNAEIGVGSVVYKDVPENCIAIGNPARIIKK